MSGFEKFAVVGAGNIGSVIVDELLKSSAVYSVVVLTRSSGTAGQHLHWSSQRVTFAVIDYDIPWTISTALKDIDVVISAVGGCALGKQQQTLAASAKSASVKLFVPSEWGNPTDKATWGPFVIKKKLQDMLKQLELPYTLFFTGSFSDMVFIPILGWDTANGRVEVGGEGNTPISWTTRSDIAKFAVHVLTTQPASALQWRTFRIEGDRMSLNQILSGYKIKTGRNIIIEYTPISVLQDMLCENPHDFVTFSKILLDKGDGSVGEMTDNNLWLEWNPEKVLNLLK